MFARLVTLVEIAAAIVAAAAAYYEYDQGNIIGAGIAGIILLLAADVIRRSWRARRD